MENKVPHSSNRIDWLLQPLPQANEIDEVDSLDVDQDECPKLSTKDFAEITKKIKETVEQNIHSFYQELHANFIKELVVIRLQPRKVGQERLKSFMLSPRLSLFVSRTLQQRIKTCLKKEVEIQAIKSAIIHSTQIHIEKELPLKPSAKV